MFYIDNFVDIMARLRHDVMRLERNYNKAQRKYELCKCSMERISTLEAYKKYSVENRALFYALRTLQKSKELYENCQKRLVTLKALKEVMTCFDYPDIIDTDIEFEALLEVKVFLTYDEKYPCLYMNFICEDETLELNKCPIEVRYNPNINDGKCWTIRVKMLNKIDGLPTAKWSDTYYLTLNGFIKRIKNHVNLHNVPLK